MGTAESVQKIPFWTENKIRWLSEAADHLGFTKVLAGECAKWFCEGDHIADIGCGIGYLSTDLLDHVDRVTAIDINKEVLDHLKNRAVARGCPNDRLSILRADAFKELPDAQMFDGMTASFFGQIPQLVDFAQKHVKGNAVWIRKNWDSHRFSTCATPIRRLRFKEDCEALDKMGIPYRTECFDLEMGQPFRNENEAIDFFREYSREDETDNEGKTGDGSLSYLKMLTRTEDDVFPYMFSSVRNIGIIIVSADELRASIGQKR